MALVTISLVDNDPTITMLICRCVDKWAKYRLRIFLARLNYHCLTEMQKIFSGISRNALFFVNNQQHKNDISVNTHLAYLKL